jgi:hypothetical protein
MEFFLGSITGFVCGFGFLFISYHKSAITGAVISLKHDMSNLHSKIDDITNSLSK